MANYKIARKTQRLGGKMRALSLSPRRRSQIAREAAKAMWAAKRAAERKAA